jgi:hypothetical protein
MVFRVVGRLKGVGDWVNLFDFDFDSYQAASTSEGIYYMTDVWDEEIESKIIEV